MEKGLILRQVIYLVQAQNPIQARAWLFVYFANCSNCNCQSGIDQIDLHIYELGPVTIPDTAVSTKVVPHKRKSVRDNADWHYG